MNFSSGRFGEEIARNLLIKRGCKIIEQNFKSIYGEIDIVAKDDDTLIFVEVKARWSKIFGDPIDAVTPWKLARIRKTIDYFCLKYPDHASKMRIEVCAIEFENGKYKSSEFVIVD